MKAVIQLFPHLYLVIFASFVKFVATKQMQVHHFLFPPLIVALSIGLFMPLFVIWILQGKED